ncbi:hypothetical protein OCV51_10490 [Faecalicatena acetigenes]|uniref:NTP pyrophosphohydrolase MazG putative catalytic core domain-containing protein n=1 Tax=Faecalicatena acetigenes TaxID=2981790 RepID=A0ABT2TEH2_9FIRM|nr:hypothetical protein [Faecalicatena acetigenes]MCU6748074.1 hypothetical protein [Faecalicatena acetigenes]SCI24278.1 Uncharacterised protein [uncultured Clostridium sp.]
MSEAEKIKIIAEHYGYDAQSRQCIEEMAELTQAINKWWRVCGNGQRTEKSIAECRYNLIEEIADVQIMLYQLGYLLDSRLEVSEMITKKLDRQLERVEKCTKI